jgi:hypothetical protein
MSLAMIKRKAIEADSRMFPDRMMTTTDGRSLTVFKNKKTLTLYPRFIKAWKENRIKSDDDVKSKFLRKKVNALITNRKENVRIIVHRYMSHQQVMSTAGGRDKSHRTEFIFKCWIKDGDKPAGSYYYFKLYYNLSLAVIRKIKEHANSTTSGVTIRYDFLRGWSGIIEASEPVLDYKSLLALTGSLLPAKYKVDGKHYTREEEKQKYKYFHTSNTLRDDFEAWIDRVDDILSGVSPNGGSDYRLVGIDVNVKSSAKDADIANVVSIKPSQIQQADGQAMFFTSSLIKNDLEAKYDDGINPDTFKARTGFDYRPNSCLATITLYFMYRVDNSMYPKYINGTKQIKCCLIVERRSMLDLWGIDHAKQIKGGSGKPFEGTISSITYELISRVTGVKFQADGSLKISFEEMECFLRLYSQPMMVVDVNYRFIWDFSPLSLPNRAHPEEMRPVCMVVSHHGHSRLLAEDNQESIQSFQHCVKKKIRAHEYNESRGCEYSKLRVEDEEKTRTGYYYIRENFDAPIMCVNQNPNANDAKEELSRVARLIYNKMIELANESKLKQEKEMEQKKRGKGTRANNKIRENSHIYGRCHFVGDVLNLLTQFKKDFSIIGGNLMNSKTQLLKSFNINHQNITMCIGNVGMDEDKVKEIGDSLLPLDQDRFASTIVTMGELERFNYYYEKIYTALINRTNISYYCENFIDVAWRLRARPLVFKRNPKKLPCIGILDANKFYTSLLVKSMQEIPVADQWCTFQLWDGGELEDWSLYVIKKKHGKRHPFNHSFVFDRTVVMYYGKFLKEASLILPKLSASYEIESYCRPRLVQKIDLEPGVRDLYENETLLSEKQKKDCCNFIMGMLDQHSVTRQSGEFYANEEQANAMCDRNTCKETDCLPLEVDSGDFQEEDIKDLYLAKVQELIRDKTCKSNIGYPVEIEEQAKLESLENYLLKDENKLTEEHRAFLDSRTVAECEQDDHELNELRLNIHEHELNEIEHMNRTNQQLERLSKRYAMAKAVYVNMYKQPKRMMINGCLWISLLKYQMARLGLLKLWIEIEDSEDLIPIGCKTDCVFVAENSLHDNHLK